MSLYVCCSYATMGNYFPLSETLYTQTKKIVNWYVLTHFLDLFMSNDWLLYNTYAWGEIFRIIRCRTLCKTNTKVKDIR